MYNVIAARYRFHLKVEGDMTLPPYKGSTLRGGFGQALKRVVCISRDKGCSNCLLKEKCIYTKIFEPEPKPLKDKKPPSAAYIPYIIEPPLEEKASYHKGESISFQLVLFGKSVDYLPYFIYAFIELGKWNGIGRGTEHRRGRFSIESVQFVPFDRSPPTTIYHSNDEKVIAHRVEPVTPDDIPEKRGKALTVNFITPTKFIYEGKVLPEKRLTFNIFMKNLFRRISNLVIFHGGEFLEPEAIRELLKKSKEIEVKENKLTFCPWTRYSSRQGRRVKLHGFTGHITFEGDIAPFYPYIYLGQITHVGKSITMGMGMYELNSP